MEFDERLDVFYLFGIIHVKIAAILVGTMGLIAIVGLAGAGVAFFEWWRHETAIDTIALIGFSIFLITGVLSHSMLLYALQNTRVRLITPFLVFHGFLIGINTVTALIAVGEIVSDQSATVDDSDRVARIVLISLPLVSTLEVFMLLIVARARWYIRLKARYLRNGRPPRVNQVHRYGFSLRSFLNRTKTSHEESSAVPGALPPQPAPVTGSGPGGPGTGSGLGPSLNEIPMDDIDVTVEPTVPRVPIVAIRVKTPDHLTGPVSNVLPPIAS